MTPCRYAAGPLSRACPNKDESVVGAVCDRAYFVDSRKSAVIDRAYRHYWDRLSKGTSKPARSSIYSPPCKGGEPPAKREPDRAKPRERRQGVNLGLYALSS